MLKHRDKESRETPRICSERRIQSHRSAEHRPMIELHANDTLTDECSKMPWMHMKYTRICLMRFSDFINLRAAVLCWWVWSSFSSCLSFVFFFLIYFFLPSSGILNLLIRRKKPFRCDATMKPNPERSARTRVNKNRCRRLWRTQRTLGATRGLSLR